MLLALELSLIGLDKDFLEVYLDKSLRSFLP